MKHYYAVESIGTNANTGRRHCASYMRFTSEAERDEWVSARQDRTAIPANDSELRRAQNQPEAGWNEEQAVNAELLIF